MKKSIWKEKVYGKKKCMERKNYRYKKSTNLTLKKEISPAKEPSLLWSS